MGDKKMSISVLLTVEGESKTTNEYKIADAPKDVVLQLERVLLEAMGKFMAMHQ